jgi:hypothetical protein
MRNLIPETDMLTAILKPLLIGCILILPAAAAPARADNKDLLKVLAGIAAIYAVTRVMEERRGAPFNIDAFGRAGAEPQRAPAARLLPGACGIRLERGRAYSADCLQSRLPRTQVLPDRCLTQIWRNGRPERVYGASCLADAGWREARLLR